jgi:hypothetical protein
MCTSIISDYSNDLIYARLHGVFTYIIFIISMIENAPLLRSRPTLMGVFMIYLRQPKLGKRDE